jgi:alpha-L-arabinofuranosidase
VWIDVVSLFPQDVPLFRPDLLDRLKALRPSFMRFPGGTYVNGNDRASRFNWKTTVGDIAARPGHSNLHWKYWSTDGLGYHEYLLLAEALGADPLYVTYIGMSWQTTNLSPFGFLTQSRTPVQEVPLDQLEPLIQDALDAIEYADGPVTSKWGALRAQAGHPKPFGLKYVEIGNEDGWSASYPERYARFYKAIKARYPEMRIVSNSSRNIPRETLDLVDAHAYIAPYAALETGKRYNDYDRKGPKVYFGEFSVQRSAGPGNLRSALAEAAMLVQFEVNSDVVPMVSFAPLFANVNSVNWRPNLIWFDGVSSFATPSYYVQKMLSENRPASVLPVEVSADTVPLPLDGGIGLAMSDTQAEFRNLRLTSGGKTILAPDFASAAEGWKTFRGQWSARDGVYRQTGSGFDLRTTAAAVSGTDYTLTVEVRKTGGAEGVRILFGVQDGGERYMSWNVGDRRRGQLGFWNGGPPGDVPVSSVESSFGGAIGAQPELSLEPGRWYELKIEVSGRRVRCSLDGRQINEITVPETLGPAIYAGAGRADGGDIILKIVNIAPAGQEVAVRVAGLAEIEPRGLATVLTSGSLEDENTLADPERVVPRRQTPDGLASPVRYRIPGNSVTVLRVKEKK